MVHSEHMETFVCDHISPTARAFFLKKVVAEIDAAIHTPIRRCDVSGAKYSGQWGVQSGRFVHQLDALALAEISLAWITEPSIVASAVWYPSDMLSNCPRRDVCRIVSEAGFESLVTFKEL
jgi:hypothetical protein